MDKNELTNFITYAVTNLVSDPIGTYFAEIGNGVFCVVGAIASDGRSYSDDIGYTICCKMAVNCDDLQCDYDVDWVMPFDEGGYVMDIEHIIYKGSNLNRIAADMLEAYETIKDKTITKYGLIIQNNL